PRARASRGPGARRAARCRGRRRAVRRCCGAPVLLAEDGDAAAGVTRRRDAPARGPAGQVPGLRVGRPPAPGPPVAGWADRRGGPAEEDAASWRRGPPFVRRTTYRAGEGVRTGAEGRLVGARRGRRRPAGEARTRARLTGVRTARHGG